MMDLSDAITPACMENPYYNDSGRQSQPKTRARPEQDPCTTETRRHGEDQKIDGVRFGSLRLSVLSETLTRSERDTSGLKLTHLSFALLRDSVAPWCKGLALNLTSALSSAIPFPARVFHGCR